MTAAQLTRDEPSGPVNRSPRVVLVVGLAGLAVVGLFACYLRLARAVGTNADGAGDALQSWDMLHGNVLLPGWSLSDVPFYTVELVEFAVIELFTGLHPDALTAGAALSYTLVVVLVAILARGRARGRTGRLHGARADVRAGTGGRARSRHPAEPTRSHRHGDPGTGRLP
jgi:hypothetical protein